MQDFQDIFPRGDENTAYARYFTGQSYLNMLSTDQVVIGNVTPLSRDAATTGTFTMQSPAAVRYYSAPQDVVTIRNGGSLHKNCILEMW